jgi:superfamily II DNA or RNA helicase
MIGNEAEFRSMQREAINAITAGESPVVAVMPTSGGKSLLFMLPAFAEQGGTTIIVVPVIALRGDMKQRCQKLGISCVAWESRHPPIINGRRNKARNDLCSQRNPECSDLCSKSSRKLRNKGLNSLQI